MADPLEVFALPLGPLQANCFIVVQGEKGLVIDPGDEAGIVIEAFNEFGFPPAAVLVTHGHFDHFGGVAPIARHFDVPVYVGAEDAGQMADGGLGAMAGFDIEPVESARTIEGEQTLDLPIPVLAIPTPGHSRGSYTFAIGEDGALRRRPPLPGQRRAHRPARAATWTSCSTRSPALVRRFPPDAAVHSGHGPDTSLGRELALNPFLSPLRYDPEHRW